MVSFEQNVEPFVSLQCDLFHALLCFLFVRLELLFLLQELLFFLEEVAACLLERAVDRA
jgi:hypothetical protein